MCLWRTGHSKHRRYLKCDAPLHHHWSHCGRALQLCNPHAAVPASSVCAKKSKNSTSGTRPIQTGLPHTKIHAQVHACQHLSASEHCIEPLAVLPGLGTRSSNMFLLGDNLAFAAARRRVCRTAWKSHRPSSPKSSLRGRTQRSRL